MSKKTKLVFGGLIKARVPKAVESAFNESALRRGKKPAELAREVFNDFIARERAKAQPMQREEVAA